VYDVLKAMEEVGRVQRGYFARGVSAIQFALPAALDRLRALRDEADFAAVRLAAADPANPYGALLPWPAAEATTAAGETGARTAAGRGPTRSVGAQVVLVGGGLAAYIPRGGRQLSVWLPANEPDRAAAGKALADALSEVALLGGKRDGLLITEINGAPAVDHALAPHLHAAGFLGSAAGFSMPRRPLPRWLPPQQPPPERPPPRHG
jgi:ATP-dependent Lhr-like helicase